MKQIPELFDIQHRFFQTGKTLDYSWRIGQLQQIRLMVKENADQLIEALKKDLGKPEHESYNSEIALLLVEIDYNIRNLKNWIKPKRVHIPILNAPSQGTHYPSPFGSVLIIGAWNYPVLLLFQPLISALAAGNCAVLKPSEYALSTNDTINKVIKSYFDKQVVTCFSGGPQETISAIERGKPNMVFFTGGTVAGRSVMKLCGEQLIPVVLELGGCCPCIVETDASPKTIARRVVWGKFFNAGQTCVAPNTCYVNKKNRNTFPKAICETLKEFYGNDPIKSPHFARIINERHFDRLESLLKRGEGKIIAGGDFRRDKLFIEPTLVEVDTFSSPFITEEIFGPILPIVFYDELEEILTNLSRMPSPLVVYLFSKDKNTNARVRARTISGSFCINSTLHMMMCGELPYGGVGNSGMGRYHGKAGFDAFSYRRAEFNKPLSPDIHLFYPPYNVPLRILKKMILLLLR